MTIIPPVLVSSSELVLEQKPEGRIPLKHLGTGQTVVAEVIEVLSDRRALLLIDGRKVAAKTFLPLQSGQRILLKVAETGDRQVFKFLGPTDDSAGPARLIFNGPFGKRGPYAVLSHLLEGMRAASGNDLSEKGGTLSGLKELVLALSLKPGMSPDGFLERLIRGCGLSWESKLAALVSKGTLPGPAEIERLVAEDLKALTLKLLSGSRSALAEPLGEQLRGFLEGLVRHQLLNQYLAENEGRYLLPLFPGEPTLFKFGQLLLGFEGQKGGVDPENRLMTVSFLLSLSRLGELRADFSILKNSLTGAFGVADDEARRLLSAHLPELRQKLRAHGFIAHDISCHVLEPQAFSEMNLVAKAMTSSSKGFLNLVI